MPSWKNLSYTTLGLLLGVLVALVVLGLVVPGFLVDLWWFDSLGYEAYFWQRLLYRYLVFALAVAFFFVLFFFNFWIGGKYLGARPPSSQVNEAKNDRPSLQTYRRFQVRSLALYLPLTLILAVMVALPLYFYWEEALLFLRAPEAGIADPVFGHDIRFYLFSLPLYRLLYANVMVALAVVLIGLCLLYWREHRTMPRARGRWRRGARLHLSVMLFLLVVMGSLYFIGDAYMLLYTDDHLPLFYGPGYEEMTVTLPLIGAASILVLITGAVLLYLLNTGKGLGLLATTTAILLAVIGLRHSSYLTDRVGEFVVEPAEMTREAPFVANNIQATLAGYGLQDVALQDYPLREEGWDTITPEMRATLRNIPTWNDDQLLSVYRELQEIGSYYAFNDVSIGRYAIEEAYRQVFLAARHIDIGKLGESQQTWVNHWLRYTHGYGMVMNPAAQPANAPIEWLIHGLPPDSVPGLRIDEPAIYYGTADLHPVIAPNATHELDYISADETQLTDYAGTGGVPISGMFRKLVFALYFGERNILYTTQTTDASRLLFRRDIQARIKTLTPDLILGPNPYLAMANGRLYWIQDAMTASTWYPYSMRYAGEVSHFDRSFNYIRHSVKVVVDAYDGCVDYYLTDPQDPIAAAHARIYPGLYKPFDAMPAAIKAHVRYPRSLFDLQMDVYTRYHQTDPETFYNQEDAWELPPSQHDGKGGRMRSHYLTLNLIDPDAFEFTLVAPMTPLGQPNLRALAVAGNDGEHYGQIRVYQFPQATLAYGPKQVNAFIKQDPKISQELNLWSRQGSRVINGRLILAPIAGVMTAIQSVFLETTTESPLPQLARIILSHGPLVVMAPSLEQGLEALQARIKQTRQAAPVQLDASPTASPEAGSVEAPTQNADAS